MKDKIELYKDMSIFMLEVLKVEDYNKFNLLLDERQNIINVLIENNEIDEFRGLYNEYKLKTIDRKMKELLDNKIEKTKIEIREYKMQIKGNSSYNNIKKEKVNIFSKKI